MFRSGADDDTHIIKYALVFRRVKVYKLRSLSMLEDKNGEMQKLACDYIHATMNAIGRQLLWEQSSRFNSCKPSRVQGSTLKAARFTDGKGVRCIGSKVAIKMSWGKLVFLR